MAQYVELPGRAPVYLVNEDLAGLDGFSLKKAFKKLKKLAKKGLDPITKAVMKKDPITKAILKKDPITGKLLGEDKKKHKAKVAALPKAHALARLRRNAGLPGRLQAIKGRKLLQVREQGPAHRPQPRPFVLRPKGPNPLGRPQPRPWMAGGPRLVAMEAQQPRILLHAGRFEEGLQGLDGFSLKKLGKKLGKGLKKVGKFIDKNKWYIAGAATAAYGGWALASKAAAGKLAAGAGAKAAASAVAKKAGTSLLSKAGKALLKGGKKVVQAAAPLATTVGTHMIQNAIAPQGGMDAYGMSPYGTDPYAMAQGYNAGMPMEAMAQGGWGGGGMPTGGTGLPSWVMPVALGGGVLLLLMMTNKK